MSIETPGFEKTISGRILELEYLIKSNKDELRYYESKEDYELCCIFRDAINELREELSHLTNPK